MEDNGSTFGVHGDNPLQVVQSINEKHENNVYLAGRFFPLQVHLLLVQIQIRHSSNFWFSRIGNRFIVFLLEVLKQLVQEFH